MDTVTEAADLGYATDIEFTRLAVLPKHIDRFTLAWGTADAGRQPCVQAIIGQFRQKRQCLSQWHRPSRLGRKWITIEQDSLNPNRLGIPRLGVGVIQAAGREGARRDGASVFDGSSGASDRRDRRRYVLPSGGSAVSGGGEHCGEAARAGGEGVTA
jgi:hypothetical protein